jgi:hypothetical protein
MLHCASELDRFFGDSIKVDLKEVSWFNIDCIHVAQDTHLLWALVNILMNCRFHKMQGIA